MGKCEYKIISHTTSGTEYFSEYFGLSRTAIFLLSAFNKGAKVAHDHKTWNLEVKKPPPNPFFIAPHP